jgi:ubiquinone biosynthesis protein
MSESDPKSAKGAHNNKRHGWKKFSPLAIPKELWRLSAGFVAHGTIGIPLKFARSFVQDSALVPWSDAKVFSIVGEALLGVIDSWGPLYGKAMQVWLSRMGKEAVPVIDMLKLDRVYGDWPPLPWQDVQLILDQAVPTWRDELKLETKPLGVASMSQVHGAVDMEGRGWVVKLLKPSAISRLTESVDAIEMAILVAEPFAVTRLSRRFLIDVQDLCQSLRREMNLEYERETMLRVHELIASKGQKSLRVPGLHPRLASNSVIVMERLHGVKLSDIISGKVELEQRMRKSIAKKLLNELLVQIFEWGLFHADPHAGNLMLLEDGAVGLYDWGLAGELLDTDRRFIAGILKAVMALDIEKLIDVLGEMGRESTGKAIDREKIRTELRRLIKLVEDSQAANGEVPSLNQMVEAALEGADRLGIPMPAGLLLMAKSLMTIEGLARGIDANVPFAMVAGPVLFRAADPSLGDIFALVKQMPNLMRRFFNKE